MKKTYVKPEIITHEKIEFETAVSKPAPGCGQEGYPDWLNVCKP